MFRQDCQKYLNWTLDSTNDYIPATSTYGKEIETLCEDTFDVLEFDTNHNANPLYPKLHLRKQSDYNENPAANLPPHNGWISYTSLIQTFITYVFYSSKFSSKIKYVNSLRELGEIIPMEYVHIPPSIVKWVYLYQIFTGNKNEKLDV